MRLLYSFSQECSSVVSAIGEFIEQFRIFCNWIVPFVVVVGSPWNMINGYCLKLIEPERKQKYKQKKTIKIKMCATGEKISSSAL